MARRGGFPASKFCNQASSEAYHCLVCFEVCRSPVTCQSGAHLFCSDCLTESLRRNPVCPVCREPLTAPIPSAFVAARVSALDVLCVHDKCKWKGTCGRLDDHLDTDCPHEPITCSAKDCAALVPRGEMDTHNQFHCLQSCPNFKSKAKGVSERDTCDVRLSRHDLVDHLAHHCKLRMTRCPHLSCEVSTAYNKMSAHTEICPHAPVACPHQCKALNLTRQTLDAHRRDCPNEPVPCVHAPLGCSHVAPRCEIVQHEQNSEVHLSALRSKAFAEQQQFYQQQMKEMKLMFVKKLEEQTTLIKKQQEQMGLLENKLQKHITTFDKRQQEQAETLEGKLEEQKSLLEDKLEEITSSLQPLMDKAKAEADAAKRIMKPLFKSKTAYGRPQPPPPPWSSGSLSHSYHSNDSD